jgi:hypothetical protein
MFASPIARFTAIFHTYDEEAIFRFPVSRMQIISWQESAAGWPQGRASQAGRYGFSQLFGIWKPKIPVFFPDTDLLRTDVTFNGFWFVKDDPSESETQSSIGKGPFPNKSGFILTVLKTVCQMVVVYTKFPGPSGPVHQSTSWGPEI